MATDAQIKANRKNALKSTGPRTDEGKETVSQNATKHGLCSCKNVISSESQDEYNLFHDEMIADLSPNGAMEEMLASRIVNLSWRLKRAEVFQNAAMELMINDRLTERLSETLQAREQAAQGDMSLIIGLALRRDFSQSKVLEQLLVYEKRIESSLYKAAAELRKLQKLRREREAIDEGRKKRDERRESILVKQTQFSGSHPQTVFEAATPFIYEGRKTMDEGRDVIDDGEITDNSVKQSQSAGLQTEIINTKSEILNLENQRL